MHSDYCTYGHWRPLNDPRIICKRQKKRGLLSENLGLESQETRAGAAPGVGRETRFARQMPERLLQVPTLLGSHLRQKNRLGEPRPQNDAAPADLNLLMGRNDPGDRQRRDLDMKIVQFLGLDRTETAVV